MSAADPREVRMWLHVQHRTRRRLRTVAAAGTRRRLALLMDWQRVRNIAWKGE